MVSELILSINDQMKKLTETYYIIRFALFTHSW